MCGRYSITVSPEQIAMQFNVALPPDVLAALSTPRYNAAPTQYLPVILNESPDQLSVLRWGLIPHWSKDASTAYKMFNARSETLQDKPSFREPLRKRRCLILADGFYEWQTSEGQGKKKEKLPIYFSLKSGEPFAFAGLWENWKTPDGEWLRTFTVITGQPNEIVAPVHNRMPMLLSPDDQKTWLDNDAGETLWMNLLRPYPANLMQAVAVSKLVNNVANDSPALILPLNAPPL